MSAEALQRTVEFTKDDQWSENPERRRAFWLGTAGNDLNAVLARSRADATAVPKLCQDILHGRKNYEIGIIEASRSVLPAYQAQARAMFDEIGAIFHEKGFRFRAALLTPREHREVGSSGYEKYYDLDPDVPIPLLQRRLIAEGKRDFDPSSNIDTLLTVAEVDRARRLQGKPTIDITTGRVTGQVDKTAATDSYFFLSPERREQVIKREQEILEGLKAISDSMLADYERSGGILDLLADYMEGKITSPQMHDYHDALVVRSFVLSEAIEEAKQLAFATGKWDHILTPQEILLRVRGKVGKLYRARPYTPLGIQDGEPLETIAALRRGEQSMIVNSGILGDYAQPFGFRLEELDERGNTLKSPTFVDTADGTTDVESERFKDTFADRLSFPFARPEDWYSQEATKNVSG